MSSLRAWIKSRLSPPGQAGSVVDTTPELPEEAALPDDPVEALLVLTGIRDWILTNDDRLVLRDESLVWLERDPEDRSRWVRGWVETHPSAVAQARLWAIYHTLTRARVWHADRALALSVLGRAMQGKAPR